MHFMQRTDKEVYLKMDGHLGLNDICDWLTPIYGNETAHSYLSNAQR
jgi:hypothetical protein